MFNTICLIEFAKHILFFENMQESSGLPKRRLIGDPAKRRAGAMRYVHQASQGGSLGHPVTPPVASQHSRTVSAPG